MVTWLQFTSLLLLCLLSELDYSSAFPRARSSVNPEAWQGFRQKQQEKGFNSGIHRPLQHIQALRQAHRRLQSNIHDNLQGKTWQKPQGTSLNHPQSQNQPSLYHQAQNPKHSSLSQTPPQRNHPLARPRSFEFSLKVPFANSPSQNRKTSQTIKGSPGGSNGAIDYRPASVQLHTSFNHPSGSDGQGVKGSTNDPHGAKNVDQVSKPSFHLSLSVPIPATTQSPKPVSSMGGGFTNIKGPGTYGFVQNSYTQPTNPQFSSTPSDSGWVWLNSGGPLQQQRENQLYESAHAKHTDVRSVTFPPGYVSQPATPVYHYPQQSANVYGGYYNAQVNPTSTHYVKGQSGQTGSYNPTNVQFDYPQQSANVYSGYYTPQVNPTSTDYVKGQSGQTESYNPTKVQFALTQSQYEGAPSGYYFGGQVKPSGNDYGQHQTWQPVGTKPTFGSDGHWQKVETVSQSSPVHPSSPTVVQSQYQPPYNQEIAATSTGYALGHMGQMDFSSSYHYSKGQIRQDASSNTDLTASHSLPQVHDVSSQYQTPMRLPIQDAVKGQNPSYSKLFVDVDDVMDGGHGQNYFASPSTHYDGYYGQKRAETLASNHSPLIAKLESLVSVNQGQLSGSSIELYPNKKPQSYVPTSNQAPGVPTSNNAPSVPTSYQAPGVPASQQASGVPTYHQASGVPTSQQASGVPTYHQASGVPTSQQAPGVPASHQASGGPTYHQASGVPASQQASGVPTYHQASGVPTSQQAPGVPASHQASGGPTYHQASGVPASQQASGVPTYHQASGVPASQQAPGVPASHQASGGPTYHQAPGVPPSYQASVVPTYHQASGVPTSQQAPGVPASHQASGGPTYHQASGVPASQQASGVPTYHQASGVPASHQASGVPPSYQASVVPTSYYIPAIFSG